MKRTLVFAVLAMAASSVLVAQMTGDKSAPKGKVEQELIKLEQDRTQAAVRGDTTFLEQNTADDYTFITPRGMLRTKAQLLEDFKSGQIKLQANDLDDLNVRVYGDMAVITGRSTQKGQAYGQDSAGQYRFTRVYVKRNGRWQSVAFQSTRIAEQ
jgi:ketosteroid isomerase-like protein